MIAKEIINEFNEKCQARFAVRIAFFIAFLRVIIYLCVKNFCDETISDYLIVI